MRNSLFIVIWIIVSFSAFAQNEKLFIGTARDAITSQILKNVSVALMDKDSTVLDTMNTNENNGFGNTRYVWWFNIASKDVKPEYIVRFTDEKHETTYLRFRPKVYKSEQYYYIGDVKMKRKRVREQTLGTATVTATRVKFYAKGDTLVYNADAFQLAEGSMLDALIRQLPGVELKDDGRIFVNGKFVESLLLNGEEFMGSNGSLLLDNLPAYMVKHVQVYDKTRWDRPGENLYTMDVRLKRQYSIGWIANAEAGRGTEDRYMGRLFALRFTPQSRVTFFGNLNNINENRKPGQDGEWSPSGMATGLTAVKDFGLDYLVKDKDERYRLTGNAALSHTDADDYTRSSFVNFLPRGDEYGISSSLRRSHNLRFNTKHDFWFYKTRSYSFTLTPSFTYRKWHNRSMQGGASFSERPLGDATALADSILTIGSDGLWRRIALNRSVDETFEHGNQVNAYLQTYTTYQPKRLGGLFSLQAAVTYLNQHGRNFANSLYEYPQRLGEDSRDYRALFADRRLEETSYYAYANYVQDKLYDNWRVILRPFYNIEHYFTTSNRPQYRLDRIDGLDERAEIGTLPSERQQLAEVFDETNSYWNTRRDLNQSTGVKFKIKSIQKGPDIEGELPVNFRHEWQKYRRASIDTTSTRNTTYFHPTVKITQGLKATNNIYSNLTLQYKGIYAAPSMVQLLNVISDSNPLDVTLGNPGLKSSYKHDAGLSFSMRNSKRERMANASIGYATTVNQIVYDVVYDRTTGRRTSRPENINGNYQLSGGLSYTAPIDHRRLFTFTTSTTSAYAHNVDLIAYNDDEEENHRSTVRTVLLGETLKADYRRGKLRVGVKASGNYYRAVGTRTSFATINAYDFRYGATLQAELPWKLQLATDLTMYSRRGYEYHEMNTNDLVWNARLFKSVMQGRLVFMVDAFDIFHQLSSTVYAINGQGQKETYRNVIPRYVMAHIIYRLNIKPKKRPGDE